MHMNEEQIERFVMSESKELLKQEYDIIQTLLEFDRINDSVFIDYLNVVEDIVLRECTRRYLDAPVSEIRDFRVVMN